MNKYTSHEQHLPYSSTMPDPLDCTFPPIIALVARPTTLPTYLFSMISLATKAWLAGSKCSNRESARFRRSTCLHFHPLTPSQPRSFNQEASSSACNRCKHYRRTVQEVRSPLAKQIIVLPLGSRPPELEHGCLILCHCVESNTLAKKVQISAAIDR